MTKTVSAAIHDREFDDSADEVEEEELKEIRNDMESEIDELSSHVTESSKLYSNKQLELDDFVDQQQWRTYSIEPTGFVNSIELMEPSNNRLELEFIYGYRGYDTRNSIDVIRKKPNQLGESQGTKLVYFVAGVGVVYDKSNHSQSFYFGHSDDISCMAVSPNFHTVATGQIGHSPDIHIWEPDENNINLSIISDFHSKGVGLLAFSPDGNMLASVGLDSDHAYYHKFILELQYIIGK